MGLLIDTTVVVEVERQQGGLGELAARAGDRPIFFSALTCTELLHGVSRANSEQRRARRSAFVEELLERIPILVFDLAVARVHAQIWTDLSRRGQLIGAHDLLIAATAITHDLELLTLNGREFERVAGLRLATLG